MKILVIGGAGYIGSHMTRYLASHGHEPWVYDDFSTGHRPAVAPELLVEGNLGDVTRLVSVLHDKSIDAVMHFAAFAQVGESVEDPAKYYLNNVVATCMMLEAMRQAGVKNLVFSSSAAVYGEPKKQPIREDAPQKPINPYGFTKHVVECALDDYCRAYGFGAAALRYFNAAGAQPGGEIGEDHDPETHLIPLVLGVANGRRREIMVFGDDYPTLDGTCIRDYIHVDDLASAHLAALEQLQPGVCMRLNLGTGRGHSVREVIEACRAVTGHPIPEVVGPRRPGDPPELVADPARARERLDWKPRYETIESIVETAWAWHRSHPDGYGD